MGKRLLKYLQKFFGLLKPKKMVDALFKGYAMLIIIPLLFLGVLFSALFTYHLLETTKENGAFATNHAAEILEESMDVIYSTSYDFMCDSDILDFLKHKKYSMEEAQALSRIQKTMQRVEIQNEIISEAYLYYKNDKLIINANDGMKKIDYLLNRFHMEEDSFQEIIASNNGDFCVVENHTEKEKLRYIFYIKSVDKKWASGDIYVIYLLNEESIKNKIHWMESEKRGTLFLLDQDEQCLLADGNDTFVYNDSMRDSIHSYVENPSPDYVSLKLNGKDRQLLVKDVGLTKLKLCFLVEKKYYAPALGAVWGSIFLLVLFIMLMSVFVARVYTRRIYRPIGNIMSIFKPEKLGYGEKSEILFIEEKFEEIQSMQKELKEHQNSQIRDMQELLIYNLMKGYPEDLSEQKQPLEEFGIHFDASYFNAFLIKCDLLTETLMKEKSIHYRQFIKENIVHCFENALICTQKEMYEFYDGEYIGILLCHNNISNLNEIIQIVQNSIKTKLDITISFCTMDAVSNMKELRKNYNIMHDIMDEMRLSEPEFIITVAEYLEHSWSHESRDFDEILHKCILEQDYNELDRVLNRLFLEKRIFYTELIQYFVLVVKVITDIIDKEAGTEGEIYHLEDNPYVKITEFKTTLDVIKYLKELCRMVGDGMLQKKQNKNRIYEMIMEYIRTNYMHNRGLEAMATEFGFSSSYFSRYIKEVTGMNYIDLINGYRIEKAKELMHAQPTLKLLQISNMVGFVSYRAFSTAFKKIEGLSPDAYRNNI